MAKIFWVEDQSHWIDKFRDVLEQAPLDDKTNHLEVYKFSEAARQRITLMKDADRPDIAILDAKMSGCDQAGISVSKALEKKWPGIPVIFLSEHNGTDIEREAFEEANVTDFISKHQVNIEEVLVWRIKAAMRQTSLKNDASSTSDRQVLTSGELKIDLETWDIYWKGTRLMNPDNDRRPLAPTPRKILRYLVEHSPRPVSTFQIAEYLDVDPDKYAYATYRQHIKTLRRAFDKAEGTKNSFTEQCKQGAGIVAFGEEGAYCWKITKSRK